MSKPLIIVVTIDDDRFNVSAADLLREVINNCTVPVTVQHMIRCQCDNSYGTHAAGCPIRSL